jgi:hypothetical protein
MHMEGSNELALSATNAEMSFQDYSDSKNLTWRMRPRKVFENFSFRPLYAVPKFGFMRRYFAYLYFSLAGSILSISVLPRLMVNGTNFLPFPSDPRFPAAAALASSSLAANRDC